MKEKIVYICSVIKCLLVGNVDSFGRMSKAKIETFIHIRRVKDRFYSLFSLKKTLVWCVIQLVEIWIQDIIYFLTGN